MSCPQYGEMAHGGAPRDTRITSVVSISSALNFRTFSQSGAVGWRYSGRLYRLKRRLAGSTCRLISAVWSVLSRTVAVHKLGGSFVHLACRLIIEREPVHTFRHQARGLPLGSRICPHTATMSTIIFARLSLDLETMPALSAYSIPQVGCGSASLLGFVSPFFRPSIPYLGAYRILHHIYVHAKPLHRHPQYGSKLNVEQWCERASLP